MTGSPAPLDLRCYLVTSGTGRRTVEVAAAAAGAGAGVVQVRAKDASAAQLLELTVAVAEAVHAARPTTRVLVDDRADVAYAARLRGAAVHGVHLGQDDLPVTAARELLGPDAVIGLTTGTLELVRAAEALRGVIDYVGAGPFRPTPTKDSGREPLGVDGYPALVAATALPIVAIGSITAQDVPALAGTGVAGVALVRAIMGAEDPGSVVREVLAGRQAGGCPGATISASSAHGSSSSRRVKVRSGVPPGPRDRSGVEVDDGAPAGGLGADVPRDASRDALQDG